MSIEENKAIVRRFWEEIINGRNLDLMDELFAVNYIEHGPGNQEWNTEGLKQRLNMYFSTFPDVHATIDDLFAEGDRCATRWTVRGTHKGEMMGIPPTGKQVIITGISIDYIVDGKLAEVWTLLDLEVIMQQLGAIPK